MRVRPRWMLQVSAIYIGLWSLVWLVLWPYGISYFATLVCGLPMYLVVMLFGALGAQMRDKAQS
jgi:hypothetical protein